jgi:hypothetical protein
VIGGINFTVRGSRDQRVFQRRFRAPSIGT